MSGLLYGEVIAHSDGRIEWSPPDADHTTITRALLDELLDELEELRHGRRHPFGGIADCPRCTGEAES